MYLFQGTSRVKDKEFFPDDKAGMLKDSEHLM